MDTGLDLCIVGHDSFASPIAAALRASCGRGRRLTPDEAHRTPGAMLGAEIIVWAFPPGAEPALEAEGYASGAIGLYAHWDDEWAEVGPVSVQGSGPCPTCLGRGENPTPGGLSPLLGAWAASWVALHCDALFRKGSTELVGASWQWHLSDPGLCLRRWPRLPGCAVAGCAQP